MRSKNKFLVALVIFLVSCQKQVKIEDDRFRVWLNPDVKLEKGLSLNLNITVTHDDVFKVYYSEDIDEGYKEARVIKSKIKGTPMEQNIAFYFPKEIKPRKIRLDLGSNKRQKVFKINSIELKYNDSTISISQDELFNYFRIFNNNLFYDSNIRALKAIKNPKKKYHPSIFSTELLSEKLQDWYGSNNN